MLQRTAVIVGAGIAGLSTGCYARMNGWNTRIFEMHERPGGLCTAWSRKGYIFDGCIHHLAGAGPASRYRPIWEELGAADLEMEFPETFVRCEDAWGRQFNVYTDLERLAGHMREVAPEDKQLIDQFIEGVRRFGNFELLAVPLYRPWEIIKIARHLTALPRWMKISTSDFAGRFKNEFLRRVFGYIQYGMADVPMGVQLAFLAGCHNRTLGVPRVDSLTFARAIEERYLALGGEVQYRSPVERILVEGDRAVGVRLSDGSEHKADLVVSAADGRSTIFELLDGKYCSDLIRTYYNTPAAGPQPFAIQVSLGVARELSGEPPSLLYFIDDPVQIAGMERDYLSVKLYSGPPFAPLGRAVMIISLDSTHEYWAGLYRDPALYRGTKVAVAERVINVLAQRFPGLRGQVEAVDVATPLTTERITGNYHGLQAWGAPSGFLKVMMGGLSRRLPGLEDFYMVGHWAEAMIGISTAALSGRRLIQRLCREDRRAFKTLP